MKLKQVRDLITVAERGSLRSAARYLGVTQPAITRSIRELERELDVMLFERRPQGMELTDIGRMFIQRAKMAQNELQKAKEEVLQYKGEAQGSVTACLSSASHIALLSNSLKPFRDRYHQVRLNLIEGLFSDVEANLKNGTVDCYIGPISEDILSGELQLEKLFDNERQIFCRKGHPLANAKSLKELESAEWISTPLTVYEDAELGPIFEHYGLTSPRLHVHAHSALSMMTATAFSDLLAMLPRQWAQSAWFQSLLNQIKVKEILPAPPIYIVTRSSLPLTPAAEYFCDMIRRAATDPYKFL